VRPDNLSGQPRTDSPEIRTDNTTPLGVVVRRPDRPGEETNQDVDEPMTTLPLRPCADPRCRERVTSGYCAKHRKQADAKQGNARERGYTTQWDAAAKDFRRRYPLCGMRPGGLPPVMSDCFDRRLAQAATDTDHVVPHRGDQRLFWDVERNWQALCRTCHRRKTKAGL
jgi:5-methylcytosine-specific restriction enzyme A